MTLAYSVTVQSRSLCKRDIKPCSRAATSLFRTLALRNLTAESNVLQNRCPKTRLFVS